MTSVSVSAQDGIVVLGKAHTRSAQSLSSLSKVSLETVPVFVLFLVEHRSFRPRRVDISRLFSPPLFPSDDRCCDAQYTDDDDDNNAVAADDKNCKVSTLLVPVPQPAFVTVSVSV